MPIGNSLLTSLKLVFVALLTVATFVTPSSSPAQDSAPYVITQQNLVDEMVNFDALSHFHGYKNTSGVESSDDPLKRTSYFFSDTDGGNYQRDIIGASGGTEHVMIDMTGPGMLTRFFLAGPQAPGNIRFYLDDNATPVYTHNLNDLMYGNGVFKSPFLYQAGPTTINVGGAGPTGQNSEVPPGLDLYLPIPFQNHIVVTYDGPSNHDQNQYPHLDYIWEYTRFRPGTGVQSWDGQTGTVSTGYAPFSFSTFTPVQVQGEHDQAPTLGVQPWYDGNAIDPFDISHTDSNHLWMSSGVQDNGGTLTIPPGGYVYRGYDGGGGTAFRYMRVNAGTNPYDLENLMINFDFYSKDANGNSVSDKAAVYESVGEFFGSGEGLNPGQTEMQSVDQYGNMQMRWTMPFQNYGGVMLYNSGSNPINVSMVADVGQYNWDSNSMHFHAIRATNGPMFMYSSDLDNNGVSITKAHTSRMMYVLGKGVLVGDSQTVINGQPPDDRGPGHFNWWGEGDELMYVDNSPFPTHRGTGSEDYFGYAYGHTYLFETPWTSQTSVPPQGFVGGFFYDGPATVLNRVRLLDTVPFNTALRYDFEIHENNDYRDEVAVDHTSYFYAVPGTFQQVGNLASSLKDNETYTIESKQNGWLLTTHGGDPATTDIPSGLGEQRFTLHATNVAGVWNIATADQLLTSRFGPQYLSCCRQVSSGANSMFLYNLNTSAGQYGSCDQQWTIQDETEYAPDIQSKSRYFSGGSNDYQTLVNRCGAAADTAYAGEKAGTIVQGYTDNTSQTSSGQDTTQVWRFNFVPSIFFGKSNDPNNGVSPPGKEDPIIPNGVYEIRNAAYNNLAIDVPGSSTANALGLQVYDVNGSGAQLWVVNYIGNGIYSIVNANSGLALDDGGSKGDTRTVQYTNQEGNLNQQWAIIQQFDLSVFFLKNILTNQVLTIGNNQFSAGAPLIMKDLGSVPWQTWVFQPVTY